ncbi:hypothetical protein IJ750_00010 [bacterium]|nr:hypothetical protein [bacterium]
MKELEKYIKLREEFSLKLEPAAINAEKTCWNFYTDSTEENAKNYETAQDNYSKLFQNREFFERFSQIDADVLPKHEAKQLKDLMKEFDEELNTGEALKALRKKENEIAKKLNSYVPKIDGREVSKTEITKILQTESDEGIRKKAYDAKTLGGELIAEDLIDFIKMRNEYAKTKNYSNYFDYKLKESYDVETEFLNNLIDEVYKGAKDKIKDIQEDKYKKLRRFFKTDNLKPYHHGLLLEDNPEKGVNEILENYNVEEISKQIYAGMGYDVEGMVNSGKLTLDLYPRKGKNTHGFCFGVEAGKDSRILANLTNNVISLDTLNHEMGHCIYDLGISSALPFLDKQPSSPALTEAIAMMMGDIMKKENVLKDIIPPELLKRFKGSHKEDEAAFVSRSLLIIDFEREFYENSDTNPSKLWNNLTKKYLNRDDGEDSVWATIPHYLSHPAYYQNYFRATIMKAQIYAFLRSKLGELTYNKTVADYMQKNIFSLGASVEEYDLIKNLTGKAFSAEDFIKSL